MLLSTEQLVQEIHDSPVRIVLAASGGGSRAIADLLEVPGGSRTLLEAVVPYSVPALAAWLGSPPEEACSNATARAMAMVAFLRARRLDVGVAVQLPPQQDQLPPQPQQSAELPPQPQVESSAGVAVQLPPQQSAQLSLQQKVAGVACTASLATDRPKRGPHRMHVAMQTAALTAAWSLELQKGRRSRAEEERLAGRLLLHAVAEACGLSQRLPLDLLEGEQVQESRIEAPRPWQDLLLGNVDTVHIGPAGDAPKVVFPGAFNPLHVGHRRMMEIAREILQSPVTVEISILNVDKPPLDYLEIQRRLAQFAADQSVCLTRAATFEEKSRLFPGATFVVGIDTLRRIAEPRYYSGDSSACRQAVDRIAGRGCRFLVFGRNLGAGFVGLADVELPAALRQLCREVPLEVFCEDASSTALRKSRGCE